MLILSILTLGYLWLTNSLSMKKQQTLRVLFSDVMGLETGDKIMFRGMEAGRVKSVELHEQGILVSSKISSAIRIPAGSRFYIEDSLMGSRSLNILPSANKEYLDLNFIQPGETPTSMMAMIAQAGDMLNKLDKILKDIDSEGGMLDLGEKLLRSSDTAVREARHGISGLKTELSATIAKVDLLTSTATTLVDDNRESLKTTLDVAPKTLSRVNNTLDSLQVLSANLNRSATAIADGAGSAGKLLTEDDLYLKLIKSIDSLDTLIADIKRNPRKYIKFSVF